MTLRSDGQSRIWMGEMMLEADDRAEMTPEQFGVFAGRKLGTEPYSDQSVRNWCKRGMAHETRSRRRGAGQRFVITDPERALDWMKQNKIGAAHGGRRTRAGRRSKTWRASADRPTDMESLVAEIGPDGADTERSTTVGTLPSLEHANRRKATLTADAIDLKLQRERGELVSRDDVTQAITRMQAAFVAGLDRVPSLAAREIAAVVGIDDEQQRVIEDLLTSRLNDLRSMLAENPMEDEAERHGAGE